MTTSNDTAWAAVEITDTDLGGRCLEFLDDTDLAQRIFLEKFGESTNFMSPTVVSYQIVGECAVEISKGSTIMGAGEIFGVTVLELDGRRTDLSKSFHSHAGALRYVAELA